MITVEALSAGHQMSAEANDYTGQVHDGKATVEDQS